MQYYNLNVHSCYDLLNSSIKLDELFLKLKKNNIEAICISDPNMYGAIKSYNISKKYNIQLIHSLEIKIAYNISFLKVNLLCKTQKMFYKLLKLSTIIQTTDEEISFEYLSDFLKNFIDDVIIIVISEIKDTQIVQDIENYLKKYKYYLSYNENFDYNFYSNIKNVVYIKESNYLNFDNYQTVLVTRAIRDNNKLNINELSVENGENYVYTNEDFYNLCKNIENPLKREFIFKTVKEQQKIISNCKYFLDFGANHLPKYKYSNEESIFEGKSSYEYLTYLVIKGAKKKLVGKSIKKYKDRYEYELKIINEMGFSDYFLIVYDFVKYAKENNIYVGAGRGSAAGSLVCYLLDITEADPLEYNLLFERFLNKERVSLPDIDIDFQDTCRDKVIKYVESKYGKEKVAQIITFTTFQSKGAARESARILQFPESELRNISKLVDSNKTLFECYEKIVEFRNYVNSDYSKKRWFKIAMSLENLPRNSSTHAAGIVISDEKNLDDYVALDKSNVTNYLTQWAMDDLEKVGLLKIDFLGIRYLTMLENIVTDIKKQNPDFSLDVINFKDFKVYNLFSKGNTEGIFQFESSGMKEKLRLLKPTEFNDIVAMNALYRPGPMAQIENYVKRKYGKEEIRYLHPNLEKILKDTYGVIVYQEQIMLIAVNFARMTLNEADNMRRAVSKKNKEDLEKYGKIFILKTVKEGYSLDIAKKLFELIVTFANYGFNKSHAVVYSMLAYKLAYLKVYYPKNFMTALLNNVIGNDNKINEYKQELNNLGIKLLKPDINRSVLNFSVYKNDILFSLVSIKNVGYSSANAIIQDRDKFGNYLDVNDFLRRMDKKVDYQAAVSLVKSGALDIFGYNRATLLNQIKEYYSDNRSTISEVRFGVSTVSGLTLKVEELEDFSIQEKLAMEKEATGTYFLKHPAQLEKEKYYYLPLKNLSNKESDSYVEIINKKEIKTKNGDYMAFLKVNDGNSDYDITIFPNVYKYVSVLLKNNNFFVVSVKPQLRNDKLQYILEKITLLETYKNYCLNNIKQIYVLVDEENEEFVKSYVVSNGGITTFCFFNNKKNNNKIIRIKNEQDFVRNYLANYPNKPIKISYK